jgi:hypothetical protein
MKPTKKIIKVYMCGSMEGRQYAELFYEHYYIRNQLSSLGLSVFDPLLKESHKPDTIVGMKGCGLSPRAVYKQDLTAVERADVIFWITGDIASEGSITEISWAGCMNRFKKNPRKTIVIVSPKRYKGKVNHFANMHKGVKVVRSVEDGLIYLKRKFHLKGV